MSEIASTICKSLALVGMPTVLFVVSAGFLLGVLSDPTQFAQGTLTLSVICTVLTALLVVVASFRLGTSLLDNTQSSGNRRRRSGRGGRNRDLF